MDLGEIFTTMPSWALFALVTAFSMLASEGGAMIGKRRRRSGYTEPEAPIATAVAAMLGLLAFMLGFTFSITAERYGDRKNLVIQQANAISTSYLRSSMIPEKQKNEVRKLYREYTHLLTDLSSEIDVEKALARMDAIHLLLWQQTATLPQEDIDSELRSLFTASVNEVIELAAERQTVGLIFRIPNALWTALVLLTIMSMLIFGYQIGVSGGKRLFEIPLVPIAFALIIVLIADMDAVNKDRFKVSREPLKNVQKMMEIEVAGPAKNP